MIRVLIGTGLTIWTCGLAPAQTFEVASIKPSAPQQGRIMVGRGDAPGQVKYANANVRMLLQDAYDVKGYQISGPGWIDSERFDVTAKVAPDTSPEQKRVMLQNMLKERFKIELHKETKELPLFALVVGKNGAKLKESVEDPASAGAAAAGGGPSGALPPPQPGGAGDRAFGGRMQMGKDGMPTLPKGGRGMMMMMTPGGRLRMAGNQVTMGRLCDQLAGFVDRPVLDHTGLAGKYDITLDFTPEPGTGPGMKMGMGLPVKGPEGGDAPRDQEAGPTIYTAVQEQLGLKLEAKKGPVDLIVVDKGEKAPTEN